MEIEILDADIFYAEALAGKLKAIHPDIRFKVCRTPSETRAAESLAGEEKDLPEDYLLICTKEHFPESRFRAPVMFLSDPDSSALKTPEDEENLPRLEAQCAACARFGFLSSLYASGFLFIY